MPTAAQRVSAMLRDLSEPFALGPAVDAVRPARSAGRFIVTRAATGFASGLAATAVMTASMELLYWLLPEEEHTPLHPSQIVMQGADILGFDERGHDTSHLVATLLAHFGYGSAAGIGYAFTMRAVPAHPLVRGLGFGLALWALSYLGWLPSTGILRRATTYSRGRILTLIASHLVWGATAGMTEELLTSKLAAR